MKIDERDKVDELFRSKLYDFESEPLSDEVWDKIEAGLDKQRFTLPAPSRRKWWPAVAAAIALLLIGNGIYFLQKDAVSPVVVDQIKQKTEELKSEIREQEQIAAKKEMAPVIAEVKESSASSARSATQETKHAPLARMSAVYEEDTELINEEKLIEETADVVDEFSYTVPEEKTSQALELNYEQRDFAESESAQPTKKQKRWSFGMGAGGVSAGSSDVANMYAFRNKMIQNTELEFLNSFSADKASLEAPKTNIEHKQPISFGLSGSYMLSPKWYLMAGLNYSYLSSEWRTNGDYWTKTEQGLHFVGLPISIAYKIAEWNSFMWYASAGFMPEVNVSGRLKTTKYLENEKIATLPRLNTRMKEWYWSVNAATGVSYPIFNFLSAYAEVGAGYYFDNGSSIETIHSDKPFNVNFSLGLRLGF